MNTEVAAIKSEMEKQKAYFESRKAMLLKELDVITKQNAEKNEELQERLEIVCDHSKVKNNFYNDCGGFNEKVRKMTHCAICGKFLGGCYV